MTRTILVLGCVLIVALALWAMRRGWRNRLARSANLPALPAPPTDLGTAMLSATGLYVGTTTAANWQDRVLHDGLGARAAAALSLYPGGLLIDRRGARPIFVPATAWVGARVAPALAGKVVGAGGLLVLRWQLGGTQLDSGFRADDKSTYPTWLTAINERISA